jgi:tRNA pseudouridine55 synthase
MNGILIINKKLGYTSRDVVNKVCKCLNTKKVGHTGTLDPKASGVLVLCVGNALKICELLQNNEKEYVAEVILGISTDTLDMDFNATILEDVKVDVSNDEIYNAVTSFKGKYLQEVPMYSSVKVNGRKLYEYARNNIPVDLPHHKVKIYSLERITPIEDNSFYIKCHVSKGTYIRSLINDICKNLGTIGVMEELNRTKQGKYLIEDSYTIEDIKNNNYKIISVLDSIDIPKVEIDNKELLKRVLNGNKLEDVYNYNEFIFTYHQDAIAIYKKDNSTVKPVKVFNSSIEKYKGII